MDSKTPEINPSSENPQVKKEWIFPRMYRDYKVIAADPTNLMISSPLHGGDIDRDGLSYDDDDYPYVDCLVLECSFGIGGGRPNKTRERIFSKSSGFAVEEGEETDRIFPDFYKQYEGYINFVGITEITEYGQFEFHFRNSTFDDGYGLTFGTNKGEDHRLDRREGELAYIHYDPSDGRLGNVATGDIFERRENGDVNSPRVKISVNLENQSIKVFLVKAFSTREWGPLIDSDGKPIDRYREIDANSMFSCRRNDGEEFDFTCAIENNSLIVSQIYRKDGTV